MAKGNGVVVVNRDNARQVWGYISGTPKPGTVMQLKAGTADSAGRFTYEAYNRDDDAERPLGAIFILDLDYTQGKTRDDAYASGDFAPLWPAVPGDEYNLLLKNISGTGTGDEVSIGTILTIDDGTGKLIPSTGSSESPGSPEIEPFVSLEEETDVTADVHIHVQFTGY